MEVRICIASGLRNDLLVVIPRSEIEEVLLSIPKRDGLLQQAGIPRHRERREGEYEKNRDCKVVVKEHLARLGVLDDCGKPRRRTVVVGNRNLGNNHGVVAWQNDRQPELLQIQEDPLNYATYSCLVADRDDYLTIRDLRFDAHRVFSADEGTDISDEIRWATFGQSVLRAGAVVNIEEIINQFYDIRHVLAFDTNRPEGKEIAEMLFEGYPDRFREQAIRALRQLGVPRSRYLHNAIGLCRENIYVLQREGTPEEIAAWLRDEGAEDAVILDNGGSVGCWAWWLPPEGGFIFTAPDYRPRASSVLAFMLAGPVKMNLPGGSVSYSLV